MSTPVPSPDAARILRKLQDFAKTDSHGSKKLVRRRSGTTSPPSNDLIAQKGKRGKTVIEGVTDDQLTELSTLGLASVGTKTVQLTERGLSLRLPAPGAKPEPDRHLRWQRVVALATVAGVLVSIAVYIWPKEGTVTVGSLAGPETDQASEITQEVPEDEEAPPSVSTTISGTENQSGVSTTEADITTTTLASDKPQTDIEATASDLGPAAAIAAGGTAAHSTGVAHIEVVLTLLGKPQIYWNDTQAMWQERSWRNIVEVADTSPGAEIAWEYRPDVLLPPGSYRLRAWSRSMDGQGDPEGAAVDFEVGVDETVSPEDLTAASEQQAGYLPSVDYEAEKAQPDAPAVRVRAPVNGASVRPGVRVKATAEGEGGVAMLGVRLQDADSGEYWNFDEEAWQAVEFVMDVAPATSDDDPSVGIIDFNLEEVVTPPGRYKLNVVAHGPEGELNTTGRTNEFTVFG